MIEIIGKNGAGKSFLANKLYDMGYDRNVGYTTRPIRKEEINGLDYHFVSKNDFEKLLSNKEFIDYKMKNGYYYGISKKGINNNTILVSGDSERIKELTGYEVNKIYIDCELETRFFRIQKRKNSNQEIFNRIHSENFSYLYDFNSLFINNNNDNDNLLNTINEIDIRKQNNLIKYLIPNRLFIKEKIKNNKIDNIHENNKLISLLKYEEYLLRKYYIEDKLNDKLNDKLLIINYYKTLIEYMKSIKVDYDLNNLGLNAYIDNEQYTFDYKIKRKVIK